MLQLAAAARKTHNETVNKVTQQARTTQKRPQTSLLTEMP